MPSYTRLATRANVLVKEFGRGVTFVRFSEKVADSNKPWRGATNPRQSVAKELALTAVFVAPNSATSLGATTAVSDLIARSSQILIVAPGTSVTDELEDFQEVVDSDDSRWKIVGLERLQPAEDTLLYFVGVSR